MTVKVTLFVREGGLIRSEYSETAFFIVSLEDGVSKIIDVSSRKMGINHFGRVSTFFRHNRKNGTFMNGMNAVWYLNSWG